MTKIKLNRLIVVGLAIVFCSIEPAVVSAQRPSASGLQAQIDALEAQLAGLQAQIDVIGDDYVPEAGGEFTGDLSVQGSLLVGSDVVSAGGVQVGDFAGSAVPETAGMLRWNGGTMQVADGTQWKPLATTDQLPPSAAGSVVYRWNVFSSYGQGSGGWYGGGGVGNPDLFGGVAPQSWGDNNAIASQISLDPERLRALFTRTGRAGGDALVVADEWKSYSSTNSKHAAVLFRIRNTTSAAITWNVHWYRTANGGWSEHASIAVNGANIWNSGGSNYGVNTPSSHFISIPPNQTSTAIFVSGSGPTGPASGDMRSLFLAFYNGCLRLPAGLEFVDDLDQL